MTLEDFGPFFVIENHPADSRESDPWRSMAELGVPAGFRARALTVRAALAALTGVAEQSVELRVAASVAHLGVVARLISPAFGVTLLTGSGPTMTLRELRWQPDPGGAFPLARIDRPTGPAIVDSSDQLAEWIGTGPVAEVTAAAGRLSVSPRTRWGNVASAVHGAATAVARARPELADRALALSRTVLRTDRLAPYHEFDSSGRFRRTNCCLIYRVAGGREAVCGDCVLRP